MKTFTVLLVLFLFSASVPAASIRLNPADKDATGLKYTDNDEFINANDILMFVSNHGNFGRDLDGIFGYDYGTFYPYLSIDDILSGVHTNTVLYAGSLWMGGMVDDELRVAVSDYDDEFVPGPMESGSFLPDEPSFQVYKLYADSMADNPNDDYLNWPVDQGAPVDDSGKPLLIGDQTLWTVFNDADPNQHANDAGQTAPLGVEVQQLVWAVDDDGDIPILTNFVLPVASDGSSGVHAEVYIIDYEALTGDYYEVVIDSVAGLGAVWNLINVTSDQTLLSNQTNFSGDDSSPVVDGFQVRVTGPTRVTSWLWSGSPRSLTGVPWGGSNFFRGIGLGSEFMGSCLDFVDPFEVEIRWTDEGAGQSAYCYRRDLAYDYDGYHLQNFTVWDVTSLPARQLNFAFTEYYYPADPTGQEADSVWNPGEQLDAYGVADPDGGREFFFILNSDYSPTEDPIYTQGFIPFNDYDNFDCLIGGWLCRAPGTDGKPDPGDIWRIGALGDNPGMPDTFAFVAAPSGLLSSGPHGLSIYMQYKLYNKGGDTINDFYLSIWADPDLGGYSDDLVGCDTLNDIFYCYNGDNSDSQFGSVPPAMGFKLLKGPVVASPGDTADFDGHPLPDFKNLRMTAFSKYINGTDPDSAEETYNFMKGLQADGTPWPNGSNYAVPGNPVAGTGDLDQGPADRRMMANFGPMTFNPGDSQYIFVKFAVGPSTDRLSAITVLKDILNTDPYVEPVDVDDDLVDNMPSRYRLEQNRPNPFNPATSIGFVLPRQSYVVMEVFNIVGQKVRMLVNGSLAAGRHTVDFDGRDDYGNELPSGMYLYRLQADQFTTGRAMILVK